MDNDRTCLVSTIATFKRIWLLFLCIITWIRRLHFMLSMTIRLIILWGNLIENLEVLKAKTKHYLLLSYSRSLLMPLYHCLADEQLAMHKPNVFIVVTVKFNIDVWLLLTQPGWAVGWRTNCQGCPLCYSDALPWRARGRGGASAVRGHGLGAFLRCDLIVDPVKLPSCLEDASVTQVRVKWHRGERLDFQMRWWMHYRNTASHRKRNSMVGMEARLGKLHQTRLFLFSSKVPVLWVYFLPFGEQTLSSLLLSCNLH